MKCLDKRLEKHYEFVVSLMSALPEEIRPICALMDAHGLFRLAEGENSPIVAEIFQALTSLENRKALKAWYRRSSAINPYADEFRRRLEQAIGEELPLGKDP